MQYLLPIALGGALGAVSRYCLGIWIANKWTINFPIHTLLINLSGAFLLGFVNILFLEKINVSPAIRLGIGIGFLGAYTTFSTFGYELYSLMESGNYYLAVLYALASLVLGLLAVTCGAVLANHLF